jgi:hypothetical protein
VGWNTFITITVHPRLIGHIITSYSTITQPANTLTTNTTTTTITTTKITPCQPMLVGC